MTLMNPHRKDSLVKFIAEDCECTDECWKLVVPMSECVNFQSRNGSLVYVKECEKCQAGTWHQDDKCLRCKRQETENRK